MENAIIETAPNAHPIEESFLLGDETLGSVRLSGCYGGAITFKSLVVWTDGNRCKLARVVEVRGRDPEGFFYRLGWRRV